jgi:hypothetical protein
MGKKKSKKHGSSKKQLAFEVESAQPSKEPEMMEPEKTLEPMSNKERNPASQRSSSGSKKLLSSRRSTELENEMYMDSDRWEDVAMSGKDINESIRPSEVSSPASEILSPTMRMEKKLATQDPNRLCITSRTWVQVTLPLCILLTIALFIWSNLSVGASVVLNLSLIETAESAIIFTSNIPNAAGEAIESESNFDFVDTSPNATDPARLWVPESRVALVCMFTSQPMSCMAEAIVQSMSRSVNSSQIGRDSARDDQSVQFAFFNFSLVSSVEHMWDGGAYALALLIAILSGAWPYIKLVSMLILWYVPVRPTLRGNLLGILETLGKWSLIDIYVFALMMAGFRFVLDVGAIARIKIAIEAKWGIFSFCIGVIVSHVLSHIMMFIHNTSQAEYQTLPESKRHFSLSSVARIRHRKLNVCGQTAISFSILVALGFTIASTFIESFSFTFSGIVGMLLPVDKHITEFSLVEAGTYIPSILDTISVAGRIGEYFVVVVYYAFAFVTPILKVVACLALWTVPLTTHQKETVKGITSVLGTWSALDVFFISIIACTLEIGNLTSSIMGETCDNLKEMLGIECLRLEAKILSGAWLMLVAVIMSLVVSMLVLAASKSHFRRVAMMHLMSLKARYLGKVEDETGATPRMIAAYTGEMEKRTFSTKIANFLSGSIGESISVHESIYQVADSVDSGEEATTR